MINTAAVIKFMSLKTCVLWQVGFEANIILSRLGTTRPAKKKATCHKTTIAN